MSRAIAANARVSKVRSVSRSRKPRSDFRVMQFGIFDQNDRGPYQPAEQYENRLKLIEFYDRAGFRTYRCNAISTSVDATDKLEGITGVRFPAACGFARRSTVIYEKIHPTSSADPSSDRSRRWAESH